MQGVLAIFNNIEPTREAEFNQWYNEQHVLERFGIPGFLSGRRYRSLGGSHDYFAWYVTETPRVVKGDRYLAAQNDPTRWTASIMRGFQDTLRTVNDRVSVIGEGSGPVAATLALDSGLSPDAESALHEDALAHATRDPRIVGAELWRANAECSKVNSTESRIRRTPDGVVESMVLLQGIDETAVRESAATLQTRLDACGIRHAGEVSAWQLVFSAT